MDAMKDTHSLRMLTGAQYRQEVSEARKRNDVVTNLPSLAAFAEKADGRFKSRWVYSGDKAQDTWGDTATTDLDPGLLRLILSWGSRYGRPQDSEVDISIAFLNSPIPEGRKIFLRPPPAFVRAGLIPEDAMYAVERGVYGLREAPQWWADKRTKDLNTVQDSSGAPRHFMEWFHPAAVKALLGVYVDDLFIAAPDHYWGQAFMSKLTQAWKTSSPEILTTEKSLLFLGTRLSMTPFGFELKQVEYAKQVVATFKEELGGANRARTTPADPDGFAQEYCTLPAQPPTPAQKQLMQKIIGALLWLSTRSRPDISFGVSKLASVLTSNYQEARLRARHLIQYLAGSFDLGLSIEFMGDTHSTLPVKPGLRIFTDASFAPPGGASHTGTIVSIVGQNGKPQAVSWNSSKQKGIVAKSSSEAELIAMSSSYDISGGPLLFWEELGLAMQPVILGDNAAALQIAQQGTPPWRTRHLSIKGQSLINEVSQSRQDELADVLTKGVTRAVLLKLRGRFMKN
eukprot:5115696-Amphidinium_carterae.1